MTDQQETAPAVEPSPELEVSFQGRAIWVKMLKPEQLLAWQRILTSLSNADGRITWNASEVMGAMERLRKIVDSLLVNKADVVWLDDQFLEGTLGFRELAPFITQVTEAFAAAADQQAPNREAKRAVKKATRKKAAK